MYGFLAALQILTRLPSPVPRDRGLASVASSTGWFPAVGAALGLGLVAFDALLSPLLERPVVDGLLIALLVGVTGAFHLDGLIDSVDGLTTGPDPAHRLAAMRDAVAGSAGAVAACL